MIDVEWTMIVKYKKQEKKYDLYKKRTEEIETQLR